MFWKKNEFKSVHWPYLTNRISLFALNSQSHWLLFANFGNLCRFLKFDQVRKNFSKKYIPRKVPRTFWILWYFLIEKLLWISIDIANFQQTILKLCNFQIHCTKNSNFISNSNNFWKLSILMVLRCLGEHWRSNCFQKNFHWGLPISKIYEIHLKLSKNYHFYLLLYWSQILKQTHL